MNRRHLGTSYEEEGLIYGPQSKHWMGLKVCQARLADLLRYPIAVVAEEFHWMKVVRRDCKWPIEAHDYHRCVVGYGQNFFRPWNR